MDDFHQKKFLSNVKISRGLNVLNFLDFFGALSFSCKPNLGLKVQLKVQNIVLFIITTHINTESSWLNGH